MKSESMFAAKHFAYPFRNLGSYHVKGFSYVDGIWVNPNNVTYISDRFNKPGKGDSGIQRIHFVGGEWVAVDGALDHVVWRLDSAFALMQEGGVK